MKEEDWHSGIDFRCKEACFYRIDEWGHVYILGGNPTPEEFERVLKEADEVKIRNEKYRSEIGEAELKYLQRLYEIEHPIETLVSKIIKFFS